MDGSAHVAGPLQTFVDGAANGSKEPFAAFTADRSNGRFVP